MEITDFIERQLQAWPMAAANFAALADVCVKDVGRGRKVQFNPARIRSTGAKVDKASLEARPCFLCETNRPAEQCFLPWRGYQILINPYPIFPGHLTIPALEHTPQRLAGRLPDMVALARELQGYTVFYNGARCGASAPDHFHFQAVPTACLPLWRDLAGAGEGRALAFGCMPVELIVTPAGEDKPATPGCLEETAGEEPMVNVLCRALPDGRVLTCVIPRRAHRPSCYGEGEGRMLVSPASVDLGGVFIVPVRKDFDAFDSAVADSVTREVCAQYPDL